MNSVKDAKEKFNAVQSIFSESTSTVTKLRSVKAILSGVSPKLDGLLTEYDKRLAALEMLQEGEFVELATTETLPENTEKEKKRKAALLLLLKSWGQLKDEVARVEAELEKGNHSGSANSAWGKIFSAAKGPLAVVTVIAIGIAVLKTTSVDIEIQNNGCGTLQVESSIPVSIPGLSLPNKPISSGESAVATIPPLSLEVDGTQSGTLLITSLGADFSFQLSHVDDVTLNGESLLGKTSTVNLGEQKSHTLILTCI